MSKKLTERFDPPKDWDFEDMLDNYGNEFLIEKEYGDELFEMELINEIYNEPLEAMTRAFYGGRYGFKDSFNVNDEFATFDGYGNLVSVNDYKRIDYFKDHIEEEEFYDWCVEEGYFESDEDNE